MSVPIAPRKFDPYRVLAPILFALDAERAHQLVLRTGVVAQRSAWIRRSLASAIEAPLGSIYSAGIEVPNRIGLAAGLDKGARLLPLWKAMGFGFVEIGTVTLRPQPGNPRPRLFRQRKTQLILNRLGFNSEGADVVAARLASRPEGLIVGGNIGKNRATSEREAAQDYCGVLERIGSFVDYVTVNVSSPNTPGLRRLQMHAQLARLLEQIMQHRDAIGLSSLPIWLKVSPDLDAPQIAVVAEVAEQAGVVGIVATNTTIDRSAVEPHSRAVVTSWGDGGLSGAPLRDRARQVRRQLIEHVDERLAVIASGGLCNADDVASSLEDGAALAQVYSGLVFGGTQFLAEVHRATSPPADRRRL